jgi:hypothetical protein
MPKQLLVLFTIALIAFSGCSSNIISQNNTGNYLGTEYEGNYIWGGAMNLAWNELNDNILHEKLQLQTTDKTALDVVNKFNQSPFSTKDVDDKSYYVKSGYGQYAVDLINRESKAKFPTKSFSDLSLRLNPTDIISYAYFLKEVEYPIQFTEKNITFEGKSVKGFFADEDMQKNNIKILEYWNDDKFIISLALKDEQDQLIIAKGFDMTSPQDIVNKINEYQVANYQRISNIDEFEMPKLHINNHREYQELINIPLANSKFTDYAISAMFENIKFDIDSKGARVENEAVIGKFPMGATDPAPTPKIKKFIMDKPFWIVMKRADSTNPYFILGVNNEKIMEKLLNI